MDKNTIIGFLLIGLIIVGFSWYSISTAEEAPKNAKTETVDRKSAPATETKAAEKPVTLSGVDSLAKDSIAKLIIQEGLKKDFGLFYKATEGNAKEIVVENEKMKITFSPKGGYISKVELKEYDAFHIDGKPLNLFIKDSSYYQINFNHVGKKLNTRDFYFVPSSGNFTVKGKESKAISFKLLAADNPNKFIELEYVIPGNNYKIDFNVNLAGLERDISGTDKGLTFEWEQYTPNQEKIISEERKVATVFYYNQDEDEDDYITEGLSDETEPLDFNVKWVSLKQQFFSSAIFSEKDVFKGGKVSAYFNEDDTTYVKRLRAELPIPLVSAGLTSNKYSFYFGPNNFDQLEEYGVNLEDEVNLGWGIFGWVNEYFMYPIVQLFDSWGIAAGLIIILLTLVIKMVLFPITYKNYLSSAKMRVIKPELDKLNEANKNADPLKKQQATMELYRKTGVNPMAGCIPALLQMPILYALFRLFPTLMELRQEPFLWAEDLSAYDSIYDFPGDFEIWAYGNHISLFTILMAVSLFFYTRFTQQMTPSASASGGGEMQQAIQKQMKIMMNIMPILMLFFFNNVASGLTFYYFLANVITIGQTVAIKKYFVNEEAIMAKIEEHKKKPVTKSRFQKKLEELQNQQKR
ncbi:MAG: membrane protein insertase YidC [Flavobacteriales bacterium]